MPRSNSFISLAWCELYLIFGNVFRKLALAADNASYVLDSFQIIAFSNALAFWVSIDNISFREYFVPIHRGKHLHAHVDLRTS